MFFNKRKIASSVVVALLFSSALSAEITVSGSADTSISYKNNQFKEKRYVEQQPQLPDEFLSSERGDALGITSLVAELGLSIDGSHDVNSYITKLNWHLGTYVATKDDYIGLDDLWVGLNTVVGEIRFGQQFSNFNGIQGSYAGNLWDYLGANEEIYSRSILYTTPTLYGVTFTVQGDIGDRGVPDLAEERNGDAMFAYATEFALNYDSEYFRADLAYYKAENSGTIDPNMGMFGDNEGESAYVTAENMAQAFYAGVMGKYSGFTLAAAYSYNNWEGFILENNYDDISLSKMLVSAGYDYNNHGVSIAYTKVFDSEMQPANEAVINRKDSLQAYAINYSYDVSENMSTYVAIDHYIIDNEYPSLFADNSGIEDMHEDADDLTVITVGLSVNF